MAGNYEIIWSIATPKNLSLTISGKITAFLMTSCVA